MANAKHILSKEKETRNGIEAGNAVQQDAVIKAFEKAGFTAEKIAKELAIISFSDMKNHVEIDEGGALQALTFKEMKQHSRAVKKVKEKTVITESKKGDELYKTSQIEYELYDKLKAIDMAVCIMGIKAQEDAKGKDEIEAAPMAIVYEDQ